MEFFLVSNSSVIRSPVDCITLKFISFITFILFIMCIVFNSLLLIIFCKYKSLCTPVNKFIIALTVINLIGSIFEYPLVVVSNFYCGWIFTYETCVFIGFVMYLVGCISIYLMTAISFERYYIIQNPLNRKSLSSEFVYLIIFLSTLFGILWSAFPLFGWSYYSLEGALTSCSVEWAERSFNVISYNISMFVFVYILPLGAIAFTNIKLVIMIRNFKSILIRCNNLELVRTIIFEKKTTVTIMFLIVGFIITWTPYAIVSLYSAFIDAKRISPLMTTLPAFFAKSSMLWPSVLFMFSNSKIRKKLNKSLFDKMFTPKRSNSSKNSKILNNRLYMRRVPMRRANPSDF